MSGEPDPIAQLIDPTVIEPPPIALIVPIAADRLFVVVTAEDALALTETEVELETDELEPDASWSLRRIAVSAPFTHVILTPSPSPNPRRIPETFGPTLQTASLRPWTTIRLPASALIVPKPDVHRG